MQQMKHEIEEMENGIGKSNEEQNADSGESAKKAAQKNGNANGYNGYEFGLSAIFHFFRPLWQRDAASVFSNQSFQLPILELETRWQSRKRTRGRRILIWRMKTE